MRAALLIGLFCCLSSGARGQERATASDSLWLRGIVTDTVGRPIPNASVSVEPQGAVTRAGPDGRFALRVAAGPAELIVRSIGYGALRHELTLAGGTDLRFEIELPSVAVVLDAFRIESRTPYLPPGAPAYLNDFYRRRAQGLGRYLDKEDIQRFGSAAIALTSIPGVQPSMSATQQLAGIRMNRCMSGRIAWFVDGFPVHDVPEVSDFEIVAIEVYRGAASMPPEAIGNACGAVFLWLRRS